MNASAKKKDQETVIRVEINPDKTRATLFISKGLSGSPAPEMKAISQAIKESTVSSIDSEQLKAVVKTFLEGEDKELSYTLVEGTPSTRGEDRKVQVLADMLSAKEKMPVIERLKEWKGSDASEYIEFDLNDDIALALVEKGDVVAKIISGSDGEEGRDIFGNAIPGLPGNDPSIKLFKGLLQRGSDVLASQDGLLLFKATEKNFHAELIDYHDAKIGVHISEDAMEAKGDLFREQGAGISLTFENVKKVLITIGVKKGIDWEGVEKACAMAREKGSSLGCVLAIGELPVAKGTSAVKWLVSLSPPMLSDAASVGDAGAAPEDPVSAETAASVQVKAGDRIVEFSEPIASGRPGFDVKGNEIPIDRAVILKIEHDNSIREVSKGKGKCLIAARSGDLRFNGKELKISSVKTIQGDVGQATGNIKFSGEIRIKGNVLPGTVVIGGSHVIVGGAAQEALISAGGKAIAAQGVKGGGRGIIRARAGIETAFTERASVMAIGDIKLKKGAILSSIKTNGKLFIAADNGKLSGGICYARYGVDAADIGSEKGMPTEISFGQDYLVKDQIHACEDEIAKISGDLSAAEEKIDNLLKSKTPLSESVTLEKVRLIKLLEQLKLKLFNLKEKFEEHNESEIRIRGSIFPGVIIESHNRYYEVKQKRSQVIFYFDRETGRIKEKPWTNESR